MPKMNTAISNVSIIALVAFFVVEQPTECTFTGSLMIDHEN